MIRIIFLIYFLIMLSLRINRFLDKLVSSNQLPKKCIVLDSKIPRNSRYLSSKITDELSSSASNPSRSYDSDLDSQSEKTHFGNRKVNVLEKKGLVEAVFSSVAPNYDIMNDVMSAGIHRLWKDEFVNKLNPVCGSNYIDVAGGTGDISFKIIKKLESQVSRNTTNFSNTSSNLISNSRIIEPNKAQTQIVVYDINAQMLEQGKLKERDQNRMGIANLQWVQGDAENMPYEDNTFDFYTIAFGIRNCTNIPKIISEARRILKPGGKFLCLEFSNVTTPIISDIYDLYSFNVIPLFGKIIANDSDSYNYLVESIRQFPDQAKFKLMIEEAGFRSVSYTDLTFGVAAIHCGFK